MDEQVINVLQIVGNITLLIVFALITIRTIADFWHALSFPTPQFLRGFFERQEDQIIERVLKKTGLLDNHDSVRQFRIALSIPPTHFTGSYQEALKEIIIEYVDTNKWLVGRDGVTEVRHFINLRSAILDSSKGETLAKILLEFIKHETSNIEQQIPIVFDCIVGNKHGSPALSYLVAQGIRGNFPLLWVSNDVHIQKNGETIFIEGSTSPLPQQAILIDDSTTDGRMIMDCVEHLRAKGIKINHVFLLFSRKEKDVKDRLAKIDVYLHSIWELDDEDISKWLKEKSSVSTGKE